MQVQGTGNVYSVSSVYGNTSYGGFTTENVEAAPQDSSSIGAFSADSDTSAPPDLNELYSQKAQVQSELDDLKGQTDEAQSQINARRQEIIQEQQGDGLDNEMQAEFEEAQAEYEEAAASKNDAQQEFTQIQQDSSANDRAISANSQQKQQVSADLSSAQGELASLTPPSPPSGDDPEAEAAYQAELQAYQAKKNALESKINSLQQQLQQLESEANHLQTVKTKLAQEQQQVQSEIAQYDGVMQAAQAKIDEAQNRQTEDNPELQQALEEDGELQALQDEFEQLQQMQAEKEAEISQLEAQIAEAEAKAGGAEGKFQDSDAEAFANDDPTLDDMKEQISREYGISPDEVQVISAGSGNDTITVTAGDNGEVLITVQGKTTAYSQEEAQKLIIDAGEGSDIITIDAGVKANMHIAGGGGNDYIQAGGGNDTIYGGDGNDTIYGLSGDDVIFGGQGKDYIDGGRGNDVLYGGQGEDDLIGGKDNDKLYGGADNDLLVGASGSDYAAGQDGSDRVIAEAGDKVQSDENDPEVLQLETVDVPDNFIIEGDATEIERIESDLEFLASTENGQMLFDEIIAAGTDETIQATEKGSSCTPTEQQGTGRNSTVNYNLTKIQLSGNDSWSERAPVVSLFHELCHAYNNAKGNKNTYYYDQNTGKLVSTTGRGSVDSSTGAVKGSEWQAVGMPNSNIEANPELLTENGLRDLLGYKPRERYY